MSLSIEALKAKLDSLLLAISNGISDKLGKNEAAVSANKLTSPFNFQLTNDILVNGNLDGSSAVSFSAALKTVLAQPGTFTKVTVDSKGRVVAAELLVAADIPNLDAAKITSGTLAVARIPILNQNTTGNAATADALKTPRLISLTDDAIGGGNFDGTGPLAISVSLKNTGVTAGDYGSSISVPIFSVDGKGRITLASNEAIRVGSTSQTGVVKLNSSYTSDSDTEAATPSAVKVVYDLAAAAIPASQKGANNGVCEIGATGKIPASRVPILNQNTTGNAATASTAAKTVGSMSGGSLATMYTRSGVLHGSVGQIGDSYAPLGSFLYDVMGGKKGIFSFGHLSKADSEIGSFIIHHINDSGAGQLYWEFNGQDGSFTSAGEVFNYSDIRLKSNVAEINNALDRIDWVRGVTFIRTKTGKEEAGFIADDWVSALPHVVDQSGEFLKMAYGQAGALTLQALKELKAIVIDQGKLIEEQNGKIAALERQLIEIVK